MQNYSFMVVIAICSYYISSKAGNMLPYSWTHIAFIALAIVAIPAYFSGVMLNNEDERLSRLFYFVWIALLAMSLGFARPEPNGCETLPRKEHAACIEERNEAAEALSNYLDRDNDHGAP